MNFNGDDYRNVETFDVIPKNSSNVTDNNFQCSDNYIISGNNVQKIKNSTFPSHTRLENPDQMKLLTRIIIL